MRMANRLILMGEVNRLLFPQKKRLFFLLVEKIKLWRVVFRRETVLYLIKVKLISMVCEAKATERKCQSTWTREGSFQSNTKAPGIRMNEDLKQEI